MRGRVLCWLMRAAVDAAQSSAMELDSPPVAADGATEVDA